jgi:ABC-type bacteriocin/lantibiotic exporter with double-glycine peptidase domain
MKIDLLALRQGTPHTCLPASIRIVLNYYGYEISEEAIAEACQVNRRGARFDHAVQAIRPFGFAITRFKEGNLTFFKAWTSRNRTGLVIRLK